MSVIATAVRHLMAAGVTGDALVDAIADMEAAQPKDAVAERRRAWDRERKRAAKAAQSGGNPVESAESAEQADSPLSRPPNENNSNPPTHTPEPTPRARKGHRLPDDWQPGPLPAELATAVAAWPVGALERELAKFKDWAASATGQIALKADWQAAWRNWLRRAIDEGRVKQNGNDIRRSGGSGTDRRTTRESGERVAARFAAGSDSVVDLLPRLSSPGGDA